TTLGPPGPGGAAAGHHARVELRPPDHRRRAGLAVPAGRGHVPVRSGGGPAGLDLTRTSDSGAPPAVCPGPAAAGPGHTAPSSQRASVPGHRIIDGERAFT